MKPKSRPALGGLTLMAIFVALSSVASFVEQRPVTGRDILIIIATFVIGGLLLWLSGATREEDAQ